MPLAHPVAASPTSNFSVPALAVTFATSHAGEDVGEFQARIAEKGMWGQSGVGRQRVELVFTRASAARLVEMFQMLDENADSNVNDQSR